MDLVDKYLKLSEAWPGTPEWKKQHDPNYNPYDPEGKARKALKQQPYGYRGKSAEGEEEEKPAEQPAMKKRGRPKKVREEFELHEEENPHYTEKQSDGTHKVFYKTSGGETKHIGTITPPRRGTDGNYEAKHVSGSRMTPSSDINTLAKSLAKHHRLNFFEEVDNLEEKISVVPAGTPNTGINKVGGVTMGTMARKPKPTTPSPTSNLRSSTASRLNQIRSRTSSSLSSLRKEDVQVDEAAAEKTYNYAFDKVRSMDAKNPFSKSAKRTMYTKAARNAFQRMKSSGTKPNLPEEVEQIDELSPSTLMSYYGKRSSQTGKRISAAMDKIEGKPSKSDVYNKGLQSAQLKFEKKRKEQTGMNPQKPRPAQPPAYPLGGRDPASGRSYSEEVEGVTEARSSKYKIKAIGTDKRGEYYVHPTTGEKIYSAANKYPWEAPKRGDHVNPNTGKVTKEEVEIEEGVGGTIAGGVGQFIGNKIDPLHGEILRTHGEMVGRAAEYTIRKHVNKLHRALKSMLSSGKATNEEVEQVDELSKSTLASYAKKASHDARMKMATGKDFERISMTSKKPAYKASAKEWESKYKSDARRREAGVSKAIDRLAKEEVEPIEEIKKQTLMSYVSKAAFDGVKQGQNTMSKDHETSNKAVDKAMKRLAGIRTAVRKIGLKKNEEVELDEISAVTHAKYRTAARADIRKTAKNLDVDSKASDRIQKRVAGLARSTGLERAKNMTSEETTPPFTPDKPKKQAVAGKYGREYSTARHLARMGVQAALKDLKKGPEKGSKQV